MSAFETFEDEIAEIAVCEQCQRDIAPRAVAVQCKVCGALIHQGCAGKHLCQMHGRWGYVHRRGDPPTVWHEGQPPRKPRGRSPLARWVLEQEALAQKRKKKRSAK